LSNIKDRIEYSCYYKYQGIAPEGFILLPLEIMEDLQDFDNWKDFKSNPYQWLESRSKEILKNPSSNTISLNDNPDLTPDDDYGDVYDEYDY
jgi:hypothetical protein